MAIQGGSGFEQGSLQDQAHPDADQVSSTLQPGVVAATLSH